MIRIVENSYDFKGGKTLKYSETVEITKKTNAEGQEQTVRDSTFRIIDPAAGVCTPSFLGDKEGDKVLPRVYNDSYMVYFIKGSNILYKIKPCESGSEELYQKYEFDGKKIKGIRQQGKFDVFIITIYDSKGEVEIIFDMKSFKPVSEKEFTSLEFGERFKDNQRGFRIEKSIQNGLETTVGVVNILTGEIESSEVLEEPTIIPSVVTAKKDNKTCQCVYDLKSKKAISDCFEFIGEGVKDLETGQEYDNNSHYFMDSVRIGGTYVPFVGIVNGSGQIAPVIFNVTAKELVRVPLIREDGIDFLDREKLSEILSSERRSINVSNIATTVRRINRDFLVAGVSKRDLKGYDICINNEPTAGDGIDLIETAVTVGDTSLTYLCQRNDNGDIINVQLKPIKYEYKYEKGKNNPHYCREIFGSEVKRDEPVGLLERKMGSALYPFSKEFSVGGIKIVFSGELRNDGIIKICNVTITGEIKELNMSEEIPNEFLRILAELNLSTITNYVNIKLFDPTIALGRENLGMRMLKIHQENNKNQ